MRYPAHADDVARGVAMVAAHLLSPAPQAAGGVYHLAGAEQYTKFGMARVIAEVLGISAQNVVADPNPPAGAPRPQDCRLDASRLAALGFTLRIRFADGLRAALAPFVAQQ